MKRSKWKGPFINKINSTQKLPLLPRNYEVTSRVVGLSCNVYSGKKLIKLNLVDDMIGHKLGEFCQNREKFELKKKKKKK